MSASDLLENDPRRANELDRPRITKVARLVYKPIIESQRLRNGILRLEIPCDALNGVADDWLCLCLERAAFDKRNGLRRTAIIQYYRLRQTKTFLGGDEPFYGR